MVNFVKNEATDYQVMSLMMDNQLPEEKHNIVAESLLFERYRDGILSNYASYQESYGNKVANSLLFEIGPVSPYGIDTAGPVLTHLYESGLAHILIEKGMKKKIAGLAGDVGGMAAAGSKTVQKKAGQVYQGIKTAGGQTKRAYAATRQNAKMIKSPSMSGKLGAAMGGAANTAKAGVVGAKNLAVKGTVGAKNLAVKGATGVASGATNLVKSVGKGYAGAGNTGKIGAGKAGAVGRFVGKRAKNVATAGAGAAKFAGTTAGKALGSAAIAAAAIYAGYKVYKNYISKAGKACATQKGGAKKVCMLKYKNTAVKAQMAAVRSGASKCSQAKDPAKCKAAIANKLQKLQGKIA